MKHFSKKLTKTLVLSTLAVITMSAFASAAENELAVAVGTTTGSNLNLRKEGSTSAEVLNRLELNTALVILDKSNADWYRISYNGQTGYVSSQYLAVDEDNVFDTYGRVTGSSVNVRADATTNSTALTQLGLGKIVPVTGLKDGWFSVKLSEDSVGYIRSDYLTLVKDTVGTAASGTGSSVTDYAAQFLGTKYIYGAASPSAFDCSGFTMYVYKQFGVELPHSAASQWTGGYGTKITSRSNLQAGDLVFFNDPSRSKGKVCSHAGIYVGNNEFIHASSGKKGVVYSSLNEDYYNKYYIGGIRLI